MLLFSSLVVLLLRNVLNDKPILSGLLGRGAACGLVLNLNGGRLVSRHLGDIALNFRGLGSSRHLPVSNMTLSILSADRLGLVRLELTEVKILNEISWLVYVLFCPSAPFLPLYIHVYSLVVDACVSASLCRSRCIAIARRMLQIVFLSYKECFYRVIWLQIESSVEIGTRSQLKSS